MVSLLCRRLSSRCFSNAYPVVLGLRASANRNISTVSLVPQKLVSPRFLQPQVYHPESSAWIALEDNNKDGLERGSLLKVVSWNIDWSSLGPAVRATAALGHLQELFKEAQDPLVVMLQEVRAESLQAILENSWVQRNFVLSNTKALESLYVDIPGNSGTVKRLDWRAAPYFSLLMISRTLAIENCFRVPFFTEMGRDALVVDIPIFNPGGRTESQESLRLCTTHLESLWEGKAYRPGQLGLISTLLKGSSVLKSRVVAGLVGGDMNAIDKSEHDFHRASDVDLKDVWEDVPAPPVPVLKPFQKDFSYGRARGNTWGYQSNKSSTRKRLDKFYYTGSLETVALNEAPDIAGRIGRICIGLKTVLNAWEHETVGTSTVEGKLVEKPHKHYYSQDEAVRLRDMGMLGKIKLLPTKVDAWVSDHFGIAVGIKVGSSQDSTV